MWNPRFGLFPPFGAVLTVRREGKGSLLVLEGSYTPPGGVLGRLFDRAIGKSLANRTMDALLQEMKHYIERRTTP
ncbi:MAG: hypothetical protein DLM53_01170 [Candidatus Eremiobacter antarcticus]|nr:MAG: hypothetical protein DLM53_01170 [Candidatus Eremiobacter sp. RRmetagenome_bin22]